jgi:hypothetical protein
MSRDNNDAIRSMLLNIRIREAHTLASSRTIDATPFDWAAVIAIFTDSSAIRKRLISTPQLRTEGR